MSYNKRLVIIGAGGHGRVAQDMAKMSNAYSEIVFLDDADVHEGKITVVGKTKDYVNYVADCDFFVAIGNNGVREKILKTLRDDNAKVISLIHPNAVVAAEVIIGEGSIVMAGTVVNTGTMIGKGCIINTCSSVDHDCVVGDFCHISVGSHLAGTVNVGERTFVGAGAIVINNVSICNDCMIGAGAVVVKNIDVSGTYKGVPAVLK